MVPPSFVPQYTDTSYSVPELVSRPPNDAAVCVTLLGARFIITGPVLTISTPLLLKQASLVCAAPEPVAPHVPLACW